MSLRRVKQNKLEAICMNNEIYQLYYFFKVKMSPLHRADYSASKEKKKSRLCNRIILLLHVKIKMKSGWFVRIYAGFQFSGIKYFHRNP